MHVFRHSCRQVAAETLARAVQQNRYFGSAADALCAAAQWECAHSDYEAGAKDSTLLPVSDPEGLRFYALDPNGYAAAARQWQAAAAMRAVWVLGLRTMGSYLAPLVTEVLAPASRPHRWLTLRPRGPYQDRFIAATRRLRQQLAAWRGHFLVVDEGPGQSGSSFAAAVRLLLAMGIELSRITLLASWRPKDTDIARFSSSYAATHWSSWHVIAAAPLPPPEATDLADISGGRWRTALGYHRVTPVWPIHERRKYLAERGTTVIKFAGWGPYNRSTHERAQALTEAGWGPPLLSPAPTEWLRFRRIQSTPAPPSRALAEFAGRYCAWVAANYQIEATAEPSHQLQDMIAANLDELHLPRCRLPPPAGPVCLLDGRVARPEWGVTAAGFVKYDGSDHGDDQFFPGPCDIAWDLAALGVEFGSAFGAAAAAAYLRQSGESARALAPRLAWHRLAYAAFRAGYCAMAAEQTPAPEAARFRRASVRYRVTAENSGRGRWR